MFWRRVWTSSSYNQNTACSWSSQIFTLHRHRKMNSSWGLIFFNPLSIFPSWQWAYSSLVSGSPIPLDPHQVYSSNQPSDWDLPKALPFRLLGSEPSSVPKPEWKSAQESASHQSDPCFKVHLDSTYRIPSQVMHVASLQKWKCN